MTRHDASARPGSFAALDRALRAEGYEPRAPSAEVAAQDEGVCLGLACRACRGPGLEYRPYVGPRFQRRGAGEYRPLAVCRRCGQALEF